MVVKEDDTIAFKIWQMSDMLGGTPQRPNLWPNSSRGINIL